MPARKIRFEVFDEEGNRYTIAFEGKVTREKALSLLDVAELLGSMNSEQEMGKTVICSSSKFDKTKNIVDRYFPSSGFTSKEVLTEYEQEFNEPISLSTVSTYLSRMAKRGMLIKGGAANSNQYQLATKKMPNTLIHGK